MILNAKSLQMHYGDKTILDDVSFVLQEREKVALIGVNGTGKSSLLHALVHPEEVSGQIVYKKGVQVSILPQNPVFSQKTVMEEARFCSQSWKEKVEEYEIKSILNRLGLDQYDMEIAQMSGGQQKRLALALALLQPAQLLLLDEPTNHLDSEMIEWLENWLIKTTKTVFMVTHDRYFLNRVCTRILELDQGVLYSHEGNYETYLANKQQRLEQAQASAEKVENLYRKELAWVRAGVQARGTKQKSRLDRFEQLRAMRTKNLEDNLELVNAAVRMGKKTISWQNLGFGYDKSLLFHGFSYTMKKNERLGIVGRNGLGKSTFLKLIAGVEKPDTGTLEWGDTVKIGWFAQGDDMENLNMRVIDYVEDSTAAANVNTGLLSAASLLERFSFARGMHQLPLYRLSGGERRRLYLLKVLMQPFNVLLLDEPTNDLDLVTLEILEDFLDSFCGLVIAVSHDRYFLDRVCDSIMVLDETGTFTQYMGGYTGYLESRQEKTALMESESSGKKKWKPARKPGLTYMEKKELAALPALLEELQAQIDACNQKLATLQAYEEILECSAARDAAEAQLEEKSERWLELEEKAEAASS